MEPVAEQTFKDLEHLLSRHDPVELLTQLTLTFLFIPADEFQSDASDIHKWARWIEFLAGLLITRAYSNDVTKPVDGTTIEEVERLLDLYFRGVHLDLVESVAAAQVDDPAHLLASARTYSLHVRGEAYPHQLFAMAQSLYGPHDEWFRVNLGFTIDKAIAIAKATWEEYGRRNRCSKERARAEATAQADAFIRDGKATEEDRKSLTVAIGCRLHYGNSAALLRFTDEELASISGVPLTVCQSFLRRMSQEFGHRSPEFPATFTDPVSAPWDYNTFYGRPLICREGRYWLVVPGLMPTVLFSTFYFDLMRDHTYRETFSKTRGAWLENETAACLRRVFPADEVLLNPCYPNGNELADVMVLHDRKVLIVQCKSKGLRHESRIGVDLEAFRTDFRKAVEEAYEQGLRAWNYLDSSAEPRILVEGRELAIDRSQVSARFILNVTPLGLQDLTTRFANHGAALGLFRSGEYPWSLSLAALDVLTDLLPSPAAFLHYATRRLHVERTRFSVIADEMDLLGLYLSQGLYFDEERFRGGFNFVGLSGFSVDVDRYVWEKHERRSSPEKLKQPMPPGFEEFLRDLEDLDVPYTTDCAMALLDHSYSARQAFIEGVQQVKDAARKNGKVHRYVEVMEGGRRGTSFIGMDAGGDRDRLLHRIEKDALLQKHANRCLEWVGFGWDVSSHRAVDVALFVSYEWREDPELDSLVDVYLRPRGAGGRTEREGGGGL